jgi:hypothetical protein
MSVFPSHVGHCDYSMEKLTYPVKAIRVLPLLAPTVFPPSIYRISRFKKGLQVFRAIPSNGASHMSRIYE